MNIIIKIFYFLIFILFFFNGKIFSEINIKNHELKHHIIVSLTTNKDDLISLLLDRLIKSLLNQTLLPFKILLSINKDDITYISDYLELLIKKNIVEVIFVNEDLMCFNKYYYIPNEYKKYIILVFDNYITLEKNSIENLFKSYLSYPDCISARRVFRMNFDENYVLESFNFWTKDYKIEKKPKFYLFAIHGEGTLFPPNKLNLTYDFIYYFKKAIKGYDFILKYYELNKNLKTVYVNQEKEYSLLNIKFYQKYSKILTISLNEYHLENDFGKNLNLSIYNNIIREKHEISKETENYFLNNINDNIITNDILLVSMTSYPARIYGIYEVFLSLLDQSADISSYECFLTLAKEEFINGEKDLPFKVQKLIENKWIKIIWHHNIRSHKKVIPIMQIYPKNNILIVDDDIIRTHNFIKLFQEDHKLYPTDIICGAYAFFYDNNLEQKKLNGYRNYGGANINPVPNIIFQSARAANGLGGVLYPKGTFSDKRFFNETLYMNISNTSDELWQFAFIIIENKISRQTSVIIDDSVNFVNNSQKISLTKINVKNYPLINERLINLFPEYKNNLIQRQKKIIISLTSNRHNFKNLNLVLESIFNNEMKPSKVVLTVAKEDLLFFKQKMDYLINNNSIELIPAKMDLKSHNKYFEVMKKYRDYAIITIADNIIYTTDFIKSLFNSYLKNPNSIHARCVHKIMIKKKKLLPYEKWLKKYTFEFNPSFNLFAVSEGGILFPPNILNITDENLKEITKCINAEDIYIKYLSRQRNIKIIWVPNKYQLGLEQLNNNKVIKYISTKKNKIEKYKDAYLKIFPIL